MNQLFKGNAVFTFNDHEIEVEFNSVIAKPLDLVKPSLEGITNIGKARIIKSVEDVIDKHAKELLRINAEKESAIYSIRMTGGCSGYDHSRRMAALSGSHDRYLDQLLMAQNASNGVNYGSGLQGQSLGVAGMAALSNYGGGFQGQSLGTALAGTGGFAL
tara:strand:- start:3614 stop:4093 length:480 start_codon:yes stop_codon:yes gene_type:complete